MVRCPRCHHRLRAGRCVEHGPPTRAPEAALPPAPPSEIPGWTQLECLAVGGSAQVFAAIDGTRRAVVKWARWRDAAAARQFAREAELLRRAGSDVVPAVIATGSVDGRPYLVLERLQGAPLSRRIADEPYDATRADAVHRLTAIARTVACLHARGIVHGDLKPENIFLHDGVARLIDLGLAVAGDASNAAHDGGGTLHYTSPEQLASGAPLAASDVYAIGALGFELLTGRPPFVGDRPAVEYGHALCRPPRPSMFAAIAPELDALIVECLAKTPAGRPPLEAVLATLERLRGASVTAAITPRRAEAGRRAEHGPCALLWVAGDARAHVARVVTESAGRIVRERVEGTLAAFLWHDHDDPIRAALAVARRLEHGTPAVVHHAEVMLRRSGARVLVYGAPAEHPERWCPPSPWRGLLCTTAARDQLSLERVTSESMPGFHRVQDLDRPSRSQIATVPELVARHGLVTEILAAVERALASDGPQLVTIEGGGGSGKSRALEETRRHLGARGVRVVAIGGRRGVAGRPTAGPELAAALADVPGRTELDRLRACADDGVVVLIDDAHLVEDEVLGLLETATAWERARLAVVVATSPQLLVGRPRWGANATHHARFQLRPLDDASAAALLRRLLAPARRIPDALVARLAERARGNPGALVGLTREIHRRGLVRRFPGSEEFYIAADELDGVTLEPDRNRRAARELAALPAGMPELVQLCAVLGAGFDLAELEAACRGVPEVEHAIDPAAGVAWLTRHGILRAHGDGWTLAEECVREAALERLAPAMRIAAHAAALAHVERDGRDHDADRLGRIAHHARGAGRADVAARTFIELARRARLRCAYVEAERMASQAIEVLAEAAPELLARAYAERGRARRPMALYEGARADLARARDLAIAADQRWLAVEALVDDGAVCDFTDRLAESAAAIEHAAALVDGATPVATRARVDNWLGVVRARQGRLDEAALLLRRAIAAAEPMGEHETVIGSMLMLGGVYRRALRLDDARGALDDAIASSEARGDVFHLTVGLFNRINVWRILGALDRAEADCARAIEVAERHGYGQMEIAGWLNLSEVRLAVGRDDEALEAARRSFAVARRRFGERPPVVATTWLALLEAGHGHRTEAAALLAEIDQADAARSPLLSLRRAAVAAVTCGTSIAPIVTGMQRLERADRAAFEWFVRRVAPSGPSTPACASGGTR